MTPETFHKRGCHHVVFAVGSSRYLELPAAITESGIVITRWRLTLTERLRLLFGSRLYLRTLTFEERFQPVKLTVGDIQ